MSKISIAIDGPSGVGKSSTAKALSERLGFIYVDTGAIYRTLGVFFIDNNISPEDEKSIENILPSVSVSIEYKDKVQHMIVNGKDVTGRLRTEEVSHMASVTSQYTAVRKKLLSLQRDLAKENDCIMDGRDIGTVVLPDALLKIFMTADPLERAKRRYFQLKEQGKLGDLSVEDILKDQTERDKRDSERKNAPLMKADDAIEIDNTTSSLEETVSLIIEALNKKTACKD